MIIPIFVLFQAKSFIYSKIVEKKKVLLMKNADTYSLSLLYYVYDTDFIVFGCVCVYILRNKNHLIHLRLAVAIISSSLNLKKNWIEKVWISFFCLLIDNYVIICSISLMMILFILLHLIRLWRMKKKQQKPNYGQHSHTTHTGTFGFYKFSSVFRI